jgi:hypothetical protein
MWISEKTDVRCEGCGSQSNLSTHSKKWSEIKKVGETTFVIPSTLVMLLCDICKEEE